ncbi:MAG: hypothetical protein QOG97_1129 [Acidimicrobiaceae bacterium]|nr:hypothetical protein [Acidimicrobiaceae bacterium]
MSGRSWWRRVNSDNGSAESRQGRRIAWTSAQARMHRGGFVFVMIVGVLIAAAYSNVVLVIIPVLILLRQVLSWTPYQRGQFLGRRPPRR